MKWVFLVGGTYRVTAAVTRYTKGGLEYLKLDKPKIDFTLKRAYFQMDNLIAGDQKLSTWFDFFVVGVLWKGCRFGYQPDFE